MIWARMLQAMSNVWHCSCLNLLKFLSQDDEVDEMMKAAQTCEVQPGVIDYRRFTKVLMQG
jgi:hypothetical protein